MKYEKIKANGNINRVKSMKNSSICALWNDSPSVDIIDCEELFNNIEYQEEIRVEEDIDINKKNKNKKQKKDIKYKKIFKKTLPQKAEGFAIDWNNINPFVLAIGGYDKKVSIFKPKDENISDIILYGEVRDSSSRGRGGRGSYVSYDGYSRSNNLAGIFIKCI